MKFLAVTLAAMVIATPALADDITENWRLSGFEMPESALYDPGNDRIIIGNMGSMAPDAGTDGYLSLVSTDGELIEKQWVTGLMDPKGMAIVGDSLFVADANGLVEISLPDGEVLRTFTLEGAMFPNDVAADAEGNIYVSDLMGEAIYKVRGDAAERWLVDDALTLPNGLLVDDDKLIVGSMGANMNPQTFQTETPGGIILVDLQSKQVAPVENASGLGGLDGVAMIGDMVLVNDNPTGTIYAWGEGELPADDVTTLAPGAADMSAYDNTILVPQMMEGELVSLTISE